MKRAAQLRRKNKRLTVQQSVKLAAKETRTKKRVGATLLIEKGETKKTKPRLYQVKRTKTGTYKGVQRIAGVSLSSAVGSVKSVLERDIANLELKKFKAKKKIDQRRISKIISEKKRLYKKLP